MSALPAPLPDADGREPFLRLQGVAKHFGDMAVLRGVDLDEFSAALERGVALLRERGIDVILIPPQYAPRVVAAAGSEAYLERMHAIGARHGVPIFRRYAIMREVAVGKPDALASMLTADGLHLNDLGYRCLEPTHRDSGLHRHVCSTARLPARVRRR